MKLFLTFSTIIALLMVVPAIAEEQGDIKAGRIYAESICAPCHAVARGDSASRVHDATPFQTVANTPGMTGMALSVWLQSTHPSMPNFILEPEDRQNVIAYIVSLKD